MAAERVGRLLPDGVPVEVIGNGIEVAQWQRPSGLPGASERAELDQPVRIVAVQRMVRRKRPQALAEVLLAARGLVSPEVQMVAELVGDGPQRGALERSVAGHDWIRVRGRLSRDEIRDLHWSSHAFVSTTVLEAFGIAALEARTAGVPVVALRGTGVSDIVEDGVTGVLAADDVDLARQLAALVTDRDRRRRMAEHARSVAPAQSWPAIVETSLAEYERAIAQSPGRSLR
jgi:glycosyltransferase involved in cell wall biosynthesis